MGRKNRRLNKGRVSRIGSYAIASSIKDPTCISCTTFNILAPIYKRLNHEDPSCRESDVKGYWLDRNQRILSWLLCERSSIICLQEFWVGNEELVSIYDKRLGDAGYINFKLARTNNRGDGTPNYIIEFSGLEVGISEHMQAASYVNEACESSKCSDELADIEWHNLGFNFMQTDYMYVNKCGKYEEEFGKLGKICRFGNIELNPSAGILNYGQGILEGVKAYRREDAGIFLFRPNENAIRMQIGADRMCMPSPSVDQFMTAVEQTALANRRWIPPSGKGALYIRPLLMGSGSVLGVAPASEYTFLVYASPVGNYFKEGKEAIDMYVEDVFHRTTHGGAGGVKSITNYAPVFKAISRAKSRGFSEVLYLDSVNKRNIEEASASNVFILKGSILSTPPTNGTILEGITRKSIMDIARELGYQVEERSIPVEELIDADEVFCTGTAVGVAPVGSITYKGSRIEYKISAELVSRKLYSRLMAIQRGDIEDARGWVVQIN